MTRTPSRTGEYYHLYNRGVENRTLFATRGDFDRFKAYLYLLNDEDPPRAANFFASDRSGSVYESARGERLRPGRAPFPLPLSYPCASTRDRDAIACLSRG